MSTIERNLGSLEARMDNHEWRLAEIDKKLDQLLAFQSTVSGGYKLLLSVGTIAGTLASLLTAAVLKIKGGG